MPVIQEAPRPGPDRRPAAEVVVPADCWLLGAGCRSVGFCGCLLLLVVVQLVLREDRHTRPGSVSARFSVVIRSSILTCVFRGGVK